MPIADWQFWVVSAGVAFAAWWLVRGVLPWRWMGGRRGGAVSKRATLTVGGKKRVS